MKLSLTENELNKISIDAKERKFSIDKKELLYTKEYSNKCNYFIQNYRFLLSIFNSLKDNEEKETEKLKNKLKNYLENYEELFFKLSNLWIKFNTKIEYGKSAIKNKINILLIKNELKLNEFIDSTYSIGKVISMYDSDENIGYT